MRRNIDFSEAYYNESDMSALSLRLLESLQKRARYVAKRENISINYLITVV